MPSASMSHLAPLWLILCLGCYAGSARAEYFSSVDQLAKLGELELQLGGIYRDYIAARVAELNNYRSFIGHVREQHRVAAQNVTDYLSHPMNAFALVKRFAVDWQQLSEAIQGTRTQLDYHDRWTQLTDTWSLSDEDEMRGAVKGLARLQRLYDLGAAQLAAGIIDGVDHGVQLNWHDCYEVATGMYDINELPLAIGWFEVALARLRAADAAEPATRQKYTLDCLEYLALAHYDLGDLSEALRHIDALLAIAPDHHAADTRTYMLSGPAPPAKAHDDIGTRNWFANYTRLCRGRQLPEQQQRQLNCYLDTQHNPYFVLSPLRKEQLGRQPDIWLYHGLLNDEQIDAILAEAAGHMERSTVVKGNGSTVTDIRISQQAWLWYDSDVMAFVRRLLGEVTGLDVGPNAIEPMQVANYGIGGQYDPHYDSFAQRHEDDRAGDRLLTNMFYLSDMAQGGYTVFPKVNVYARPVKGAMLSWFNMHRSLHRDWRTQHAGCAVVRGSKRIGNVWIRSRYQELRHPCALLSDSYLSDAY